MLGRLLRRSSGALALVVLAIAAVGAVAAWATPANNYSVTNLVSDQEGKALTLDPSLVNAWGLAAAADDAVVGGQQRHGRLDAVPGGRHEGPADGRRRGRRPARCSTAGPDSP